MVSTISKNVFTMFFIVSIMFTGVSSVLVGDSVMEHKVIEQNSAVAQDSAMKHEKQDATSLVHEQLAVVDAHGKVLAHGSVSAMKKLAQGSVMKQEGWYFNPLDYAKAAASGLGTLAGGVFDLTGGAAWCKVNRGEAGCTCEPNDRQLGFTTANPKCTEYCCEGFAIGTSGKA